jgi:15-cis-phytoene synthase
MPVRRDSEGTPRYWAWLYSPPRLRAVLEPLLAMEHEIRAALRPGLDHHVAHVRLEWWREECARYAAGSPVHPLMRALLAACRAAMIGTGRADPGGLVDTAAWDLAAATFATRDELAGYCDRWASAVTAIAAPESVPESPESRESPESARQTALRFGRRLGQALVEIELLGALASDASLGRLRLPLDELERAHVEPAALARPPWSASLCALLRVHHRASRAALALSVAALPAHLQPSLRGLLVWAAAAHRASLRAERALPLAWQAGGASRLADAWLAWRTARRADRREFHLPTESPT